MIRVEVKGDDSRLENFVRKATGVEKKLSLLRPIAMEGVTALSSATPKSSGKTASSWSYKIVAKRGGAEIVWTNSNVNRGAPIAIILQYGHGTGSGGWVQGRDYINPAMRPIFDKLADRAWKAVIGK